jgi:hypothetical protein
VKATVIGGLHSGWNVAVTDNVPSAIRRMASPFPASPERTEPAGRPCPPFPSPAVPACTWSAYVFICILKLGVTGQLNSVFRVNAKRCNNLSRRSRPEWGALIQRLEAPSHHAMPVTT